MGGNGGGGFGFEHGVVAHCGFSCLVEVVVDGGFGWLQLAVGLVVWAVSLVVHFGDLGRWIWGGFELCVGKMVTYGLHCLFCSL